MLQQFDFCNPIFKGVVTTVQIYIAISFQFFSFPKNAIENKI